MLGKRSVWGCISLVLALGSVELGCTKDENVLIYNKTKLAGVRNLKAYSATATAIGLRWDPSSDTSNADFTHVQLTIKDGNSIYGGWLFGKSVRDTLVNGLNEGVVYTFEFVSKASATSQDYEDGTPVSIQWAAAQRLNFEVTSPLDTVINLFEIRSTTGGSGLQFFELARRGPVVYSPTVAGNAQNKIDVLLDSLVNTPNSVILESAHRNPYLVGTARRTRFSTFDTLASTLNVARATPPDPSTYTRDFVIIGPEQLNSGRIYYAVTNDTNYVRILVLRDPTTNSLLGGTSPNRRVAMRLSYQLTPKVLYAKPGKTNDQARREE